MRFLDSLWDGRSGDHSWLGDPFLAPDRRLTSGRPARQVWLVKDWQSLSVDYFFSHCRLDIFPTGQVFCIFLWVFSKFSIFLHLFRYNVNLQGYSKSLQLRRINEIVDKNSSVLISFLRIHKSFRKVGFLALFMKTQECDSKHRIVILAIPGSQIRCSSKSISSSFRTMTGGGEPFSSLVDVSSGWGIVSGSGGVLVTSISIFSGSIEDLSWIPSKPEPSLSEPWLSLWPLWPWFFGSCGSCQGSCFDVCFDFWVERFCEWKLFTDKSCVLK